MGTLSKCFKISLATLSIILAVWVGVLICSSCNFESEVEAQNLAMEQRAQSRREHAKKAAETSKRLQAEQAEFDARFAKALSEPAPVPVVVATPEAAPRRVRRWTWMAPEEVVGEVWNVPEEESQEALLTGLVRICLAEAEGSEEDCIGIWQVLNTIRRRSCDRGTIERITECEGDEETMLSAMRRAQRFVLGMLPSRNTRQQWISKLALDCEPPDNYPHSRDIWEKQQRYHCENTIELAKRLISGEERQRISPATIITWGGRCEDPQGACDDTMACLRGLARVETTTKNAFWCRPGSTGCAADLDPICRQYLRIPDQEPSSPLAEKEQPTPDSGESS
jgi:hypothetical protein